jgi:hypothetical protein
VRHSTLIRAELEDAVAGLTPAARAVFEDIKRMDEDAGSELPDGFDAKSTSTKRSARGASQEPLSCSTPLSQLLRLWRHL